VGEKQNQPFQLSFNASLKVDFQGSRVTSDGGLILVRELDERLGLEKLIEEHLSDSRHGLNKQFTLADLLRQSVYSRLAGYEDLNDAERLAADPTFRLISSQRIWDRGAALTSTLHFALVRDRAADQGRESDRADGVEPGDAGAGRVSRQL
jgi:Transposase DDE domain group 1